MSSPAIDVDSLHKRFTSVTAIHAVNFTVHRGEVFGLLGPNGAGKSTTLNILLGLLPPTQGQVRVFGMNVRKKPRTVRDRVGVVPEDYGLYNQLTGRDHIQLFGRLNGVEVDPGSLRETVGLGNKAFDRPVSGYSTGMQQRLALATALIGDPDLLVLDEPMAGLDPDGIRLVRDIINELAERGVSVFFSSHRLNEVESVCDRVGFLNGGRLVTTERINDLEQITMTERVKLTVGTEPPEDVVSEVREMTGVRTVSVTNRTVSVECNEPGVKATVIGTFDQACSVSDFDVIEPDLEDLFDTTIPGEQADSLLKPAEGDTP